MEDLAIPLHWMPVPPAAPAGGKAAFVAPAAPCRLVADLEVAVIGIRGPTDRDQARHAIRAAIVEALAGLSGLPAQRIVLHAEPGEAPWALLDAPGAQPADRRRAWLAISHDDELSVAAISLHGPVGIDVTLVIDIPDWAPLARDYLGPQVAAALAALPAPVRPAALARAWSEREARLKYLGRELVEWSADGDAALAACRCLPLDLPDDYAGALTVPPR